MTKPPLILVSPDVQEAGAEMRDASLSLSEAYLRALMGAGGLPLAMPTTTSRECVAECVKHCDGVMLTGGEDLDPDLYADNLPHDLRRTVTLTPDGGARDLRELMLIDEVFRQRKPLLAICRGHQVLNVALGGTLVVDLPSQRPEAIKHRRPDRRYEVVHDVHLRADSLLARIIGTQTLGVNSTHHQAVDRLAAPLEIVGTAPDGVAEVLELGAKDAHLLPYLLSVQFHPERLADRYAEHRAIFRSFTAACVLNRDA